MGVDMTTKQIPVNKRRMEIVLKAEKGWVINESYSGEYVYDFSIKSKPGVVVRVFSSVSKNTDKARKKGTDSIRVCAVHTIKNKGWIRTITVNRTKEWRKNLIKAVWTIFKSARSRED